MIVQLFEFKNNDKIRIIGYLNFRIVTKSNNNQPYIPLTQIETFNIFDNVEYILRIWYEDQVIIDITLTPILWGNDYPFYFYLDSVPTNSRFFLVTGLLSILWWETVYFIDLILTLAESSLVF